MAQKSASKSSAATRGKLNSHEITITDDSKKVIEAKQVKPQYASRRKKAQSSSSVVKTVVSRKSKKVLLPPPEKKNCNKELIETQPQLVNAVKSLPSTSTSSEPSIINVNISNPPLPFPCPQCKESFNTSNQLQRHLPIHLRSSLFREKFILMTTPTPIPKILNEDDHEPEIVLEKNGNLMTKEIEIKQDNIVTKTAPKRRARRTVKNDPVKEKSGEKLTQKVVMEKSAASKVTTTEKKEGMEQKAKKPKQEAALVVKRSPAPTLPVNTTIVSIKRAESAKGKKGAVEDLSTKTRISRILRDTTKYRKPKPATPQLPIFGCNLCSEKFTAKRDLYNHIPIHMV